MEANLGKQVNIKVGAQIVGVSISEKAYMLSPELNPKNAIIVPFSYVDNEEDPQVINDHHEMLEKAMQGDWKMADGSIKNFHRK